jgi:6,7-dimethyl-8-ribityllumazine synthase
MSSQTVSSAARLPAGTRFALVASRFNQRVVDGLVEGAKHFLTEHGVDPEAIEVVRVPGAFEIPLGLETLARSGEYRALIALGAVIRGETPHFDYVSHACTTGCEAVARRHGVPVGFGLLTCDTEEQAEARAGGRAGNKGIEAAEAAFEMVVWLASRGSGERA